MSKYSRRVRALKKRNLELKVQSACLLRFFITTSKSPFGEGTNTRDRFEMRVHKRVMDLFSTPEVVKHVTNIQMEARVEVGVTIADV
ncbi:hypothetical protein L3X38_005712 [Prunus dulcis]|uniref:Small ribosomal subunit protein uS10 domain-containing protein n=1 Tax=Prunus dulcis TaxID=3755 RepID=A0AAD5F4H0_PRUDU|nr:hypothetical protein L3X38_005712 [Prunus dulcis]